MFNKYEGNVKYNVLPNDLNYSNKLRYFYNISHDSQLGPNSKLVISTPLWFWPQSQQNPDDLEEHQFGVPAQSLLLMAPTAYHINSRYLVGTFVFSRSSIDHLDNFAVITDKNFDYNSGKAHLESLGRKADDILYFITN